MQGLIRKLVAHHPHRHRHTNNSHRIFNTRAHSAFSSLPKPSQPRPQLHHIPHILISPSFLTHSCRSLSTKLRAFLSQPIIPRHFAFNSLFRVSARSLLDCRPSLHFLQHNFNFSHNHDFSQRSWRSWFHRLTPNAMVWGLIVANVAVSLLWRIKDESFMIKNFAISLDNFKSGRLHTLITNAFCDVDTWQIVSNMIGLYFFGRNIGRCFGPEFLLKLYLAGAIGGAVFYLMHQAYKTQTSKDWRAMVASEEVALGPSGAVNAVMLLYIFLFPKATIYVDYILPVPAFLLGIFFIGKDMMRIRKGDSHMSGYTHLGGTAVAAIAWAGVRKGRF